VAAVNRINQDQNRAGNAEIPEGRRDHRTFLLFGSDPLDEKPREKKRLPDKTQRYPELIHKIYFSPPRNLNTKVALKEACLYNGPALKIRHLLLIFLIGLAGCASNPYLNGVTRQGAKVYLGPVPIEGTEAYQTYLHSGRTEVDKQRYLF